MFDAKKSAIWPDFLGPILGLSIKGAIAFSIWESWFLKKSLGLFWQRLTRLQLEWGAPCRQKGVQWVLVHLVRVAAWAGGSHGFSEATLQKPRSGTLSHVHIKKRELCFVLQAVTRRQARSESRKPCRVDLPESWGTAEVDLSGLLTKLVTLSSVCTSLLCPRPVPSKWVSEPDSWLLRDLGWWLAAWVAVMGAEVQSQIAGSSFPVAPRLTVSAQGS